MSGNRQIRCFSCGALVRDEEGPTHPYMLSSPGCWAAYGEILARMYLPGYRNPEVRQIAVDSYACQHPGKPERKAIQSVNGHLISLYMAYEKNFSGNRATAVIQRVIQNEKIVAIFEWLDPPAFKNELTVADVLLAKSADKHQEIVRAWGRSVWQAWRAMHFDAIVAHAEKLGSA